jgi:ankyrin repeat protein
MLETALYQAVEMERHDQIITLLNGKADPNISNGDGCIPLHLAVEKQDIQIVETLLINNSNPNHRNKHFYQTPVHYAIKYNVKAAILLLLVQYGGSLCIRDNKNKRPIDYIFSDEMRETIDMLKLQREDAFKTPKKDFGSFSTPGKFNRDKVIIVEEIKEVDEHSNHLFTIDHNFGSFVSAGDGSKVTSPYTKEIPISDRNPLDTLKYLIINIFSSQNDKTDGVSQLCFIKTYIPDYIKEEDEGNNTLEYSATKKETAVKVDDSLDEDEEIMPIPTNKIITIHNVDNEEISILTPSKKSYVVSEYHMTTLKKSEEPSSKKIMIAKKIKPMKYHKANDNKENNNAQNVKSNSCILSPLKYQKNNALSPNYKRKLNFSNLPNNSNYILNSDDEVVLPDRTTIKVGTIKYGNTSTRNTSANINTTVEDKPHKQEPKLQKAKRDNNLSGKTIIHYENDIKKIKRVSTLTDISKLQSSNKQSKKYLETIFNISETENSIISSKHYFNF